MQRVFLRASMVLLVLANFGASAASAASMNVSGATGLAVAAVIAPHSPFVSAGDKRIIANLFDGNERVGYFKGKLSVTADALTCRVSSVDITLRSCEITFGKTRRSLKGRAANEVYATLAVAGVVPEGAAGSSIESISKLSCTLVPGEIKDNSGGGVECTFTTE